MKIGALLNSIVGSKGPSRADVEQVLSTGRDFVLDTPPSSSLDRLVTDLELAGFSVSDYEEEGSVHLVVEFPTSPSPEDSPAGELRDRAVQGLVDRIAAAGGTLPFAGELELDRAKALAQLARGAGFNLIVDVPSQTFLLAAEGKDLFSLIPEVASLNLAPPQASGGPSLPPAIVDAVTQFREGTTQQDDRDLDALRADLQTLDRAQLRDVIRALTRGHYRYGDMRKHGSLSEAPAPKDEMIARITTILGGGAFGSTRTEGPLAGHWASDFAATAVRNVNSEVAHLESKYGESYVPPFAHNYESTEACRLKRAADDLARLEANAKLEPKETQAAIAALVTSARERLAQAEANVHAGFERLDAAEFAGLRAKLRDGTYTPDDLRRDLDSMSRVENGYATMAPDRFVEGLFGILYQPAHTLDRSQGNFLYQSSYVDHVLEVLDTLKPTKDDVVFDVGAGLGKVLMLTTWLTGAKSVGIEYEKAHADLAREAAQKTGIDVEIRNEDAQVSDYSQGDIFFFFNPFRRQILQNVADRLKEQAAQRPITICGLCLGVELAGAEWLVRDEARSTKAVTVYTSKPPGDAVYQE